MNAGFTNQNVSGTNVLIGSYGTYGNVFESVNWLYFDTACTCTDTYFTTATAEDMFTSI
jgi:hypothetical protein